MAIWKILDTLYIRNPHPVRGDGEVGTRDGKSTKVYLKVGRPYFRGVSIDGEHHISLDLAYTYRVDELGGDNTCLEASRIYSFPILPALHYQGAKISAAAYENTWIVQGKHHEQMVLPTLPGTLVQGGRYVIDTSTSSDAIMVGATVSIRYEIEYDPARL